MSIPQSYKSPDDYIVECFNFLSKYEWLYNYSNTQVLVKNILSKFPREWSEYFKNLSIDDINNLPLGKLQVEACPESLQSFLQYLERLQPKITVDFHIFQYKFKHNSCMSKKKLHEVVSLAPCIHDFCTRNGIDSIVDVGAGVGYLSCLLNDNYNYPVLGVECAEERLIQAIQNQKKYYKASIDHVFFVQHYIDEKSALFLKNSIKNLLRETNKTSSCMVGLHACADLSLTVLKLFMELDDCTGLVIMPCCYHRLKIQEIDGEKEMFENFPISTIFEKYFAEFEAETFLRRPFLRLACQQNIGNFISLSEEEHTKHARSFLHRAVLEKVVIEGNWQVHRKKRKSPKSSVCDTDLDFKIYLENLKKSHKVTDQNGEEISQDTYKTFLLKMYEKWNEHKNDSLLMEILTGLQASLQSLCENLVLLDRVEFLKEHGFHCTVRKVTDDLLSPRCYALVAVKSNY